MFVRVFVVFAEYFEQERAYTNDGNRKTGKSKTVGINTRIV